MQIFISKFEDKQLNKLNKNIIEQEDKIKELEDKIKELKL